MGIQNVQQIIFKCITYDLKPLSSLWFDMHSICYLLCNNMHSYRSGKWHRKGKEYGNTSVCLVEMYKILMKQIRFLKSGYPYTVQFLRRLNLKFASPCIIIQFKCINQLDATTSEVYYLTFMYSSTCFGRPHAHHQ
jgi:hypothetical protein